jgi:hypothetical protein
MAKGLVDSDEDRESYGGVDVAAAAAYSRR